MNTLKTIIKLIKNTYSQFSNDNGFMMAGALAYYTLFSIAPLLVIVLAMIGIITQSPDIEIDFFNQLGNIMGQDKSQELQEIMGNLRSTTSEKSIAIISIITLLISATAVVIQLKDILNKAWNIVKDPALGIKALVIDRLLSMSYLVGIGFIFLVSLGLNSMATIFSGKIKNALPQIEEMSVIIISFTAGILMTFSLFFCLFKFLPDAKIKTKDLLIGSAVTTFLFVLGKYLIGFYIGNSDINSTFGSAGALASFMIWVYYNGIILILGAEFTQVYALHNGRAIYPTDQSLKVKQVVNSHIQM